MRAARKVPGVKKVFVRSGIRYDLALECPDYVQELVRHHVSGLLKIAPEHVSDKVLRLMGKSGGRRRLDEFRKLFEAVTAGTGGRPQHLEVLLHGRPPRDDREGSPRARRFPRRARAERGEAGRGRPDLHADAHDPLDLHVSHGQGPHHRGGRLRPPSLRREEGPEADARRADPNE
ncbi:MAG: hypothetical protein MZV63_65865 [Marinilabiliales bacterium]|nr:hypothetical protein [Marinilabiliales bacterium]